MKHTYVIMGLLAAANVAAAQDQQVGARTKAMGGSYTAFEDDPVSVWLNPAGIATQPTQMSLAYQSYVGYPLREELPGGSETTVKSVEASGTLGDPAFLPSFFGGVIQLGSPESPMALGLCYVRPFLLRYSFDKVDDPFQSTFSPDSELQQTFSRFRAAFAKDVRFKKPGETGFLTHLSVGVGGDFSFESWRFTTSGEERTDTLTSFGFGAEILVGIYDNTESFKVNLGVAYQSAVKYPFNIDPSFLPAFDIPQQLNVGLTVYLLPKMPLRLTADFQWLDWSGVAEEPRYAGHPKFVDAYNFSTGAEYRIQVSDTWSIYPRAGYRRFQAPWDDSKDLPMAGKFKLFLDTKGEVFHMFTFGVGVSWATEEGKSRTIDVAGDVGADTWSVAAGYTHEF